jgi:colicin import membrane protein
MTLQPRHLIQAAVLHVVLFVFLFVGVQCSQPMETAPVVQGVLIDPNDLKNLKPPTPPTPTPKPDEADEGPQQIVKDTDVVADQARQKQEQAAAEQQKADQQKAEEQKQAEAKAEELKQQQEAQKQAEEQAAALKKQQEEDKRKADEAAEQQRKKDAEQQLRKEAEQEQQAQAAALAKQKKAEEAQREADRRKRAEELQKQLGAESAELTAQVQNEWLLQLTAAIEDKWARPPGSDPNMKASIKIRLSPTGEVMSAEISAGSGSPLYDQTLQQAVYRASPLPLPRDPSAFDPVLNICFSANRRSCQQ